MKEGNVFADVFRHGKHAASEHFVARLYKKDAEISIGIVVSKKVSLLATRRNRLKRQLRALLSTRVDRLTSGDHLVVIAKPGATAVEWVQLQRETDSLLSALKKRA